MQNNTDVRDLSKKLSNVLNEVIELKSTHRKVSISLKSLANIQLSTMEYLLVAVGIFIVLISWLNYINQVIAQSYWRMKEIGILRVVGATRSNLKTQFIIESSFICLTSLILIIGIYLGLEPLLNSFTNGHLLPLIGDPTLINFIFFLIFLICIVLAAAIPMVILFSQSFGKTLQSAFSSTRIGSIGLRQGLVIVQFSISTVLMISVFAISNQLKYMNRKDKGIEMNNVLVVQAPILKDTTWNVKRKTLEQFKEKCLELPFILDVASSTTVPSEEYRHETFLSLPGNTNKTMVHQSGVDAHFFDLYSVKFIAGHNFIPDAKWNNQSSIILNETAAKALGIFDFHKMINIKITDHESNEAYDLIGIVKDFHQTSLKYEMKPIAFKFNVFRGHFSLKLNVESNNDLNEKLFAVRQIWEQTYQNTSFDYFLLDERFAAQYGEDRYFGKLFNCFTVLSIVISSLGLFGFSLLISTKRQKEVGVRKVFGATSFDILATLLKGYIRPFLVAVCIGSPLAYILMNMWLRNYAYRIEIGLGLMLLAWLSVALIFLLTVSYHTLKSSASNPVTILRN